MIRRLLIANRGEIAVRVIRACKDLGIETVAVYSDADRHAAHVALADQALPLGGTTALSSYLAADKILDAAQRSHADAIHPGYGFLSQNPEFAAACERAGIVFVGPPSNVIATMGSKIAARQRVQSAGVPVVPGVTPTGQTDEDIERAVAAVGLPALIKASAGGGGKGMRRVQAQGDVRAAVESARREAESAFGDGTLYVERAIERPHHIEVQVMADAFGNVVHLFERECSVQRRHQKVVEESPSPNVTPALRRRITEAAVRAATASGYRSAGTVEFLVDLSTGARDDAPFYYLEMNTRLQVEHGVTEQVVGVDLVRAQLLVASGERLPWDQAALSQRGHAIEARIYAEDPASGFLPQAGRLLLYREPSGPGIRIDSGIREGGEVSVHYDPLLAKVIATAETRELAIARLISALEDFPILGVRTNVSFLLDVLRHPTFAAGGVYTSWLDEDVLDSSSSGAPVPAWLQEVLAADDADGNAADLSAPGRTASDWDPWSRLRGWRAS